MVVCRRFGLKYFLEGLWCVGSVVCMQARASIERQAEREEKDRSYQERQIYLIYLPLYIRFQSHIQGLYSSMIPGETAAVLKDYILSILTQLNDCNAHISALERTSHKLAPNGKLDTKGNEIHSVDDKRLFIEKLEQQRLTLLMDVQRQDYVTLQLQAILLHNLDLLKSVKEYLENSTRERHEEILFSNQLMDGYEKNVSLVVTAKLDQNLLEIKEGINKIAATIVLINQALQKENEVLVSGEFETKLNGLIRELNETLQKLR